jgi:peptidyl-dipeptidase A
LRPWHWDDFFGQEAPAFGSLDLDPLWEGLDQEAFARGFFAEIGIPVDDVLDRSDLYERDGKDQHAFCTDIDREGDVRILCNLRRDEMWMRTLLHELGHAVYDKFLPRSLPFLLRRPAHTLATESIAMYFGRLTRDPEWLRSWIAPDLPQADESAVNEQQRVAMLVSTRWMLVMIHFERELYRDPERPDLNRLWWDLVEEFQLVARPDDRDAPDWATKIHLALAPVYYHNYLLGELMASQLTYAMRRAGVEHRQVGEFLRERVFLHGASLPWTEHIQAATGGPLTARHFVDQFVGEPLPGSA